MTEPGTQRLRLVMPGAAHVATHQGFVTPDRAARLGWTTMSHWALRNFVTFARSLRGFGPLVAETRDDGRPVGIFDPWLPMGQPGPEISWTVWDAVEEVWCLGREAARGCLASSFGGLGWETAVARASGAVLGWVDLQQPSHYDAPVLAWRLTGEAEVQGLAAEAALAVLTDERKILGLGWVVSHGATANTRPMWLAEKLGAVIIVRCEFAATDCTLSERPQVAA